MSAADEQHYKGEIDITADLTLPKLLSPAMPEIWRQEGRHAGKGVRDMAADNMGRIS